MTRSLKSLVSAVLGSALLVSLSGVAFAATAKDTTPPSDVEKLTAEVGDQMITLSWDAATDDVGVKSYVIYVGPDEVTSKNEAKYAESKEVGNLTKYEIRGLKNGSTYYIAVTAKDAAGNESESYSPYVAVKPFSKIVADTEAGAKVTATSVAAEKESAPEGADTTAPTVKSADSVYKNQVKILFSEPVKLPAVKPETAFTVQDNLIYESLMVTDAFLDPSDKTSKTVILETADQSPDSEYLVTVGIEVEDLAGNPISSGTSDIGKFTGSTLTLEDYLKLHPAAAAEDTSKDVSLKESLIASTADAATQQGLRVAKVEVVNDTMINISFSEAAVFDLDPTKNFEIVKKDDEKVVLPLTSILVQENKKDVVIATTMEPATVYTLKVTGVLDSKGTEISKTNGAYDFASTGAIADVTPPEDVTNLVAQALKAMAAKLKWTGSKNSAGDLLEYIIYQSKDGKDYGKITTLSKENTAYQVEELEPGYHYFKVTAKDAAGNESGGKTVKVRIVETGPGIGLVALASIGLGRFAAKRRKNKARAGAGAERI